MQQPMNKELHEWNWYGTWMLDWAASDCHWESYDIWLKAYFADRLDAEEFYELGEISSLDLIDAYWTAVQPVYRLFQPFWKIARFWRKVADSLKLNSFSRET